VDVTTPMNDRAFRACMLFLPQSAGPAVDLQLREKNRREV
jgi:hypothetical protein